MGRQREEYMQMTHIAEYLESVYKRTYTTFRCKPDGSMFYVINGEEIPKHIFEEQNPIRLTSTRKINANKSQNWILEHKSY